MLAQPGVWRYLLQDESVITEISEGDKADVDAAVAAARKAFDKGPWPRM